MSTLAIWSHVVQSRDVRSRDFSRPVLGTCACLLMSGEADAFLNAKAYNYLPSSIVDILKFFSIDIFINRMTDIALLDDLLH